MKIHSNLVKAAGVLAGAGLAIGVLAGCKPAAQPPAPKPPVASVKPNAAPVVAASGGDAHISVFEDLMPPAGRDPFFPDSHRRDPAPPPVVMMAHQASVASDLLLKGIVGSAKHRLAVINNEILEVGEESTVRIPNGQMHLKCIEIGEDYAVIKVDGEERTRRLVMDKKSW
jgi:hypothetical protein